MAEKISASAYESLIQQGMGTDADVTKTIEFLTEFDLKNLGKQLAEREKSFNSLFSLVVEPIHDIAEAIAKGCYDEVDQGIKSVKLSRAKGARKIYFCPIEKQVKFDTTLESYLKLTFGLKPSQHALNLLLSAMSITSESKFPEKLNGYDFVAPVHPQSTELEDEQGRRSCVQIARADGKRKIKLQKISYLERNYGWVVLGEKFNLKWNEPRYFVPGFFARTILTYDLLK